MRTKVDPQLSRAALAKVLSSQTFARSTQLRRFLEFTVGRALEGRTEDLKEFTIAVEAYRRPASFDPRIDPIIRTEARRLRQKLDTYYQTEGRNDPLRIAYPKGSYVPEFAPTPALEATKSSEPRPRSRIAVVAVVLGIFALGGVWLWFSRIQPEDRPVPRVAVLAFEDESSGEGNEGLALAITESVRERLGGFTGLDLVSTAGLNRFEGRHLSTSELATALRADYLVEGNVERARDSLLVTTRLIRASDRSEIWTETFDFQWSEILQIQDAIARSLALQLAEGFAAREEPMTTSAEAYEAYLKGHVAAVLFNNHRHAPHFTVAKRRLLQAVELDPGFDEAWAELGHLHFMSLYPPRDSREQTLSMSEQYLERALSIDPDDTEALYLLGAVRAEGGRHFEGVALCRKAIAIDPGESQAHDILAEIYSWMGFCESAIVEFDQAIERDPLYMNAFAYKVRQLIQLGRFEDGLRLLQRWQELDPDGNWPDVYLGNLHYRSGNLAEAENVWRGRCVMVTDSAETSFCEIALALLATERGELDEGRSVLNKYRGGPLRDLAHVTEIAALLHETEIVVHGVEDHPRRNYRWLINNPALARLAGEPAFGDLTRSLHARWLSDLESVGNTLPVPPPPLPDPDTWLRQAVESSHPTAVTEDK